MGKRKRLVLFDIDGTLVSTNGIARHSFSEALEEVFGLPTTAATHDFAGKLDTQIFREILTLAGMDAEENWKHFDHFTGVFYSKLEHALSPSNVHVLPGIKILLEALSQDCDITMALLTGNLERGAALKLGAAGLYRYFPFGAFGDDGRERSQLPAVAIERAEAHCGYRFSGKEIVIVGDTPNDILCGSALNVKTIAVATGQFDYQALSQCGPDYLYHTLEDTDRVRDAIHSE